jgi:hypothetical protein
MIHISLHATQILTQRRLYIHPVSWQPTVETLPLTKVRQLANLPPPITTSARLLAHNIRDPRTSRVRITTPSKLYAQPALPHTRRRHLGALGQDNRCDDVAHGGSRPF